MHGNFVQHSNKRALKIYNFSEQQVDCKSQYNLLGCYKTEGEIIF